uniref:Uncharacterized protein n=1 Tax=Anguilla anguilla TaxID=7936 RepID=A0A0E9V5Q3_ANGAN
MPDTSTLPSNLLASPLLSKYPDFHHSHVKNKSPARCSQISREIYLGKGTLVSSRGL